MEGTICHNESLSEGIVRSGAEIAGEGWDDEETSEMFETLEGA